MDNEKSVFDSIMQGLHEVEEHQKGKLKLKSTIISNEDLYVKYNKLPSDKKHILEVIVDDMLIAHTKV